MKYALFLGCNIPARLPEYETSARLLLQRLGIELQDIAEFGCCGYPLRSIDPKAFLLLSGRNLALAEREGLEILVLCQCCYGTLRKAKGILDEDLDRRGEVNRILQKEGLIYTGVARVKHLLQVLYGEVGLEAIKGEVSRGLEGLCVATHYGCHALRPSPLMQLDDPSDPRILEDLIAATGARAIAGQKRLDCCGAPLLGVDDELSMGMLRRKVEDSLKAGAEVLCVACPYCQLQFEKMQPKALGEEVLPAVLISQLVGLALGLSPGDLGIKGERLRAFC
ncbi:MAG: disulfide reductase [Deltaproteobacteria bacterium]|nr:MAG: disulfide reductase [Deltaproteobacteria bacterium]